MLVGKEDCDAIGDTNKYHTDREIDDDDDDDEVIIGDTDLSLPVTDSYGKNSIHDSTIDQSIETVTVGTYDTAGTMSGRNNTKDDDGDTATEVQTRSCPVTNITRLIVPTTVFSFYIVFFFFLLKQ